MMPQWISMLGRLHCVFVFFCSFFVAVRCDQRQYEGYKVIAVNPKNADGLRFLNSLQSYDNLKLDFWQPPTVVGHNVSICVPPENVVTLVNTLDAAGLTHSTLIENVQVLINRERHKMTAAKRKPSLRTIDLNNYNRFDTINNYLEDLGRTSPLCSVINIGTSFQSRQLKVLKISSSGGTKPAIWIDAGIHAREWISPAVALYLIDRLVNEYNSDPTVRGLVDYFDWYVLPSANPDGYEYSHTTERLWRKTRSDFGNWCIGTDPNRNWDYHWMETGASSSSCSDIYAGPRAFSEPETKAISEFLMANKDNMKAYVTFHAYGQYWLTPWGYTSALPDDYDDLERVANRATSALRAVHRKRYTVGTSTRVLYAAAGGSDDWAKGVAGIKYSYCVELRDTGRNGFILPASEITPSGQEMWAAIKTMAEEIKSS